MTTVLPAGRYKQKREWSSGHSIPELVSNSETNSSEITTDIGNMSRSDPDQSCVTRSPIEIQVNGVPQPQFHSTARRSSLAIGLFSDRGATEEDRKLKQLAMETATGNGSSSNKHSKRRSSIAVAFLGRKDNAKVISETRTSKHTTDDDLVPTIVVIVFNESVVFAQFPAE